MDQGGWGAPAAPIQSQSQPQAQAQAQPAGPWGSDPWASTGAAQTQGQIHGGAGFGMGQPKKDDRDPFANIWQ
jgi:hypothetical protein